MNEQEIHAFNASAVKRARKMAVTFGVLTIFWLISMVYGFVQREVRIEAQKELEMAKAQLLKCESK
ncbi:MAG: hypothetical protein HOP08_10590 [Cyclobacteriaceae bacterium]|nr:hypothetical protein [Cyclobacteriaceae bacterium]